MLNTQQTGINRSNLSNEDTKKIAKLLDSNKSSLIAFTCDRDNITFFKSANFDMSNEQLKKIFSESFLISEGSNSVSVNMGGTSTTSSFPV